MAVFFMQAMTLANWVPRIPDVQEKLSLTPGELAIALLGMPIGSLLALLSSGPLIEKITARRTIYLGFLVYLAFLPLAGWAWSLASLFAALFLLGIFFPLVDVAMNVEAARVQDTLRRPIMSTCHGFWSIGSMAGALIGAAFADAEVATRWHLLIVTIVSIPVCAAIGFALPEVAPLPRAGGGLRLPFALPTLGMLGLVVFCFGAVMGEVAARSWSALYLRDVIQASPGSAGFGYAAFSLFMACGRFLGDWATMRYGSVLVARLSCTIAVAGMVLIVLGNSLVAGIAGFAALGFGLAVVYPLSATAAAGRGDRPAALNMGALSLGAFAAFMLGPPLTGFVADEWGLRAGLATVIPVVALSAILAGELRRRPRQHPQLAA
jgi:predicted MFS family arabinose efflux permease